MRSSRFVLLGLLVCSVLTVGLICGCEEDADMENVGDASDTVSVPRSSTSSPLMSISPISATLTNNGAVASFLVEGASGSSTWSVQDISRGSILTQSARAATYQRSSAGDNVVIATDSLGNAAFATVSQQ